MDLIRSLLAFFYNLFFGCRHSRLTRPFTLANQTYKVCLDCGGKVYYSRERMEPLSAREVRRVKLTADGVVALSPEPAHGPVLVTTAAGKSSAA